MKLLKTRMLSEPDDKTLLPHFNIVTTPYLRFEKIGDETEARLIMGKPPKEFFRSIWNKPLSEPIPLLELVKLVVKADKSKRSEKTKDNSARKRIERAIMSGTLVKDEAKNISLKEQ